MEITFSDIGYLWLLVGLPLLIIIHFYSLKYIKNRTMAFANFEALKRVTGGIILSRNIFLLILRLTSLLFLVLSLAGATFWYTGESDISDYVIAIDTSGSMLANDFLPSRLEAAKDASISFIENLKADTKVGIVSFSGIGLVEIPLTQNKFVVKKAIEKLEISNLHGTAIGDALKTSSIILMGSDKSRTIILLTDGQENVASKEELSKIVEYINSKHITVNTISVATESGGILPGINTISTLDSETLTFVSDATGGIYKYSKNKEDILNAYKSFNYKSTESKIPVNMRLPFIIITLFMLFTEWVLINTKYRTIP